MGYKVEFCQDNESVSSYGVMRGLHFQRPPFTQSKLVRCVKGRVITSITQRLMGVSRYWMNHSASIGAFLRNMLIFRRRIRNMRCWRTLIVLSNTKRILFSKIIPSFFTIKEGSTFLTKPLFPQGREDVTALRCSEPLRYKVGGPSKVCAMFCGLGPPGVGGDY